MSKPTPEVTFFDILFVLTHHVAKGKITQAELDATLEKVNSNRIKVEELKPIIKDLNGSDKILADIIKAHNNEEIVVESKAYFHNFEMFNESKKNTPKYRTLAVKQGWALIDKGFNPIIMQAHKVEDAAKNDFKDINLMNDYFTGTAFVGGGKGSDKLVDFSDPMYKGQIEYGDEVEEDDDQEEIDFKYDRSASQDIIKKLLNVYLKEVYQEGTVVKSIYLH